MKKLLPSIFSLILTALLLITCVMAWYSANEVVRATGVIAATKDEDCTFKLEYYSDSTWNEALELNLSNLWPSDVEYFRLICTSTSTSEKTITSKFNGITSFLQPDKLTISNGNVVYNTVPMYAIENDAVMVGADTLYNVIEGELTLADYKLEDALNVYYLGNEFNGGSLTGKIAKKIVAPIFESEVLSTGRSTFYFAIEYADSTDNNYYAYQGLSIQSIRINILE